MAEAVKLRDPGRRDGKSAAAFRTISEVAGELDVPPHVLRFWETKFAQVKPLKRGGGRRYYRPEDVGLLRAIRDLLYTDGYTIKGVQKLLREGGVKAVTGAGAPETAAENRPMPVEIAARPPAKAESGKDKRSQLNEILDDLERLRDELREGL